MMKNILDGCLRMCDNIQFSLINHKSHVLAKESLVDELANINDNFVCEKLRKMLFPASFALFSFMS